MSKNLFLKTKTNRNEENAMSCKVMLVENNETLEQVILVDYINGFEVTCEMNQEDFLNILLSECTKHCMLSEYAQI